jgi:hypothetical protein
MTITRELISHLAAGFGSDQRKQKMRKIVAEFVSWAGEPRLFEEDLVNRYDAGPCASSPYLCA